MKILEKFRDPQLASAAITDIGNIAARLAPRKFRLMEVCGTHTFAIMRSGISGLLPDNVRLVSGPGCPVCVTPQEVIDGAVEIANRDGVIFATFGDMIRVPGSLSTLEAAGAGGAQIRVVYSPTELIALATEHPDKQVVFFAVGFETTAPSIAWTIARASDLGLKNLSFIPANKLIPPVLGAVAGDAEVELQGLICPGHVAVVTGVAPFISLAANYRIPCVIAGFEPLDLLLSVRMLLLQLLEGRAEAEIEYTRAVAARGNERARAMIEKVFEPVDAAWRGLGVIPKSGLGLRCGYRHMDALEAAGITIGFKMTVPPECACGEVLRGIKIPEECPLFRTVCTPENPVGPCIVSSEGTCAAHYKYGIDGLDVAQ